MLVLLAEAAAWPITDRVAHATEQGTDAAPPPPARELSAHVGYGGYLAVGRSMAMMAGPAFTVDAGLALTPHVWLDAGLGMVVGTCRRRSDEGDCSLTQGQAIEPALGIKVKTGPGGRFLGYGRFTVGLVSVSPDRHSSSTGAMLRAGGGAKGIVSDRFAVGVEASLGIGTGSFAFDFGEPASSLVGFDFVMGPEFRF